MAAGWGVRGKGSGWVERLGRFAPGLPALAGYRRQDFPQDLLAGLSVAAVALSVGVAYAELAGFPPAAGLYAGILPLVAYALFGTSRQLMVGPDAATCALVAASVAPLATGSPAQYHALAVSLTFLAGLLCVVGSFLRLGGLADFLSRPILVGFLNGIALSIGLGQLGKILGFPVEAAGIVPGLIEVVAKLPLTHLPTLGVGLGALLLMSLSVRWLPRMPAALVAMVLAAVAVAALGLERHGVETMKEVSAGLPELALPSLSVAEASGLVGAAAGLALIAFSSMVITARSFAARGGYEIDVDRELSALGAANLAAALSQTFAVSGADSRTAVACLAGGRTQVTGLVAAASLALVLVFLTDPLGYVPLAALGAVLMRSALSLADLGMLRALYRIDRTEFALSVLTTLGVVAVGAIDAMLLAVVLAVLRFIRLVSRPAVELLGRVPGLPGFHGVERHRRADTTPGLLMFRFNAPLVFFNAPFFKREALAAAERAGPALRWFVLDSLPVTMVDATGVYTLREVIDTLRARGVVVAVAGRRTEWKRWRRLRGFHPRLALPLYASLEEAESAFLSLDRQQGAP